MGAPDIRLDAHGNVDFRLSRQLHFYSKEDPPPSRVKPVPIQLVKAVVDNAHAADRANVWAVADMTCLGFFFLLRPGEHTKAKDNHPFRLQDVTLYIGSQQVTPTPATPDAVYRAITSVTLTFTTQKNGVRGEITAHGLSGDPFVCPVRAVVCRVKTLIHKPPATPLCTYFVNDEPFYVTSNDITKALRFAIHQVDQASLGIKAKDIEARSLRAGGATALFCAGVPMDTTQLIGRWQSDAMLRYLHVQAAPIMQKLAKAMFHGGFFSFIPGLNAPQAH